MNKRICAICCYFLFIAVLKGSRCAFVSTALPLLYEQRPVHTSMDVYRTLRLDVSTGSYGR